MGKNQLTAEKLKQHLHYDPETGDFTWIQGRQGQIFQKAGSLNDKNYVRISLQGTDYYAHQLAVLYMTGEWPPAEVDHKDTVRSNNKWDNLRLATHAENSRNAWKRSHNTSGTKGVSLLKAGNWSAQIGFERRLLYLGTYPTERAAKSAYDLAAYLYHGEFCRLA